MSKTISALLGMIFGGSMAFQVGRTIPYESETKSPINAKAQYVNSDSLIDLVYKNGDIYLQTPEGNFIPYENRIQKERAKLDSLYQVKIDSLKRAFENKLEKEILK